MGNNASDYQGLCGHWMPYTSSERVTGQPRGCMSLGGFRKFFMSLSALVVPLLLLAAGVGFLLLVFDGENALLMKYNQYRIIQARDEQVEIKQDQSMKGCSRKRVR